MDAKDLRTESALSERNNDGSKYSQSGGIALHCDRNKSYQDIGSNSLVKVDVPSVRPCAVIGPDRVVPPSAPNDTYLKKGSSEPWPCMDNTYHTRRPPEYPHKLSNFQNPTRNISPRQTFQENMQRIMVPPSYNSVKISDDTNYVQLPDRSNAIPKNIKINVPPEAKFCDVPYSVYSTNNEQKNVRNAEMCMTSVNPTLTRTAPHGWPPGSVNLRPVRTYGAPELYQYQEYPSCAGPRSVVPRPNRTVPEEPAYVYADPYYHQERNSRYKPYPTVKDRCPQQRYEYVGNYQNSFHPPPAFPPQKYELQKNGPPHPYPSYQPIKYHDRGPEPIIDGYQRNQQGAYSIPYRNQIIHPNYGQVVGNCPQNKIHSYPPEAHIKSLGPNKMPFDNAKAYIEYDNMRPKLYHPSESYLVNEMGRVHSLKNQVIMPNYPTLNIHNMPPNPYYKKDNQQMKNYEYIQTHFRGIDPNMNIHNAMLRHTPMFSPNTSAISPTDSSTSNETSQTLGTSQEDCGYVSQSSTASTRSIESSVNRIPNDYLRKYYDNRYGPIVRTAPMMSKSELSSSNHSKEKKNIDVRQFLQMWNEGDEETEENNSKEIIVQSGPKSDVNFIKSHEIMSQSNQEQLYVLGLVNVPSEELGKYEHIQKVSKLPENIKGYNHIELLNQFEEAIESSNMNNYKTSMHNDYQITSKVVPLKPTSGVVPSRPLSPLDVEAKISQSVIHKEVGCNFEIKPCSPKMLNVEVATPVQNILAERAIEKVANPVILKSPQLNEIDENDFNIVKRKEHRVNININNEPVRIPSCKMINTQFSQNNNIDAIKTSYSLQDLESNAGLCLASLPRLDNDIELNFPEVNQQFINANKGDVSVSTSMGDLPTLELLDQSDIKNKDKLNDINASNLMSEVLKSPCIIESEKEYPKLSKYRKTKTISSDCKENNLHVLSVINAARTNSVIIKNPENAKNHEEKNTSSPICLNNPACDIQHVPINLTSQGNTPENANKTDDNLAHDHDKNRCKEKDTATEIAIDFSLNKNNDSANMGSTDIKHTKQAEILTRNTIEEDHSRLDDKLSKLSTIPDGDENIPASPNDKIYEHANSENLQQDTKNGTLNIIENLPFEEIFTQDKSLFSDRAIKEIKEDHGKQTVMCTEDTAKLSSNTDVPIKFVTTDSETLQITDNINKDFLKNVDIVETKLHGSDNDIDNNNFKNDSHLECKDVANNDVADIEEINLNIELCSEINHKGNTYLTDNKSMNDHNKHTMQISVKKPHNMQSSTLYLSNVDILPNSSYHSNDTKRSTDSTCDSTCLNDIVSGIDDEHKEAEVQKTELNLPSPHCNLTQNSNYYQSKATKQYFSSSSSESLASLEPKDCLSELVQQQSDQNLKLFCSNNYSNDRKAVDILAFNQEDTEGSLIDRKNVAKGSTIIDSTDNTKLATGNHITTQNISKCIQDETSHQSVSKLNSSSPCLNETDSSLSNTNTNLLQKDNVIDRSITCETHSKNSYLKDVTKVTAILKLPVNEINKHVQQGKKYLSYRSKEMYSPWIQKLLLFCEGKINISNKEEARHNNCDMETKTEAEINYSNFKSCQEKDNITPAEIIIDDTVNIGFLMSKEFKTDISNFDDENCKNIAENDIMHNDTILQDQKVYKLSGKVTYRHIQDFKRNDELTDIQPNLSLVKVDDIHDVKSFPDIEKRCDSPSIYNHTARNEFDELADSTHVISKQLDNQSDYNDNASKQSEQQSPQGKDESKQWDSEPGVTVAESERWDDTYNSSGNLSKHLEIQSNSNEITKQWDCSLEQLEQSDKLLKDSDDVVPGWDNKSNCSNMKIEAECGKQSNYTENLPGQWDKQSNIGKVSERWNIQSNYNDIGSQKENDQPKSNTSYAEMQSICNNEISDHCENESKSCKTIFGKSYNQPNCNIDEVKPSIFEENCNNNDDAAQKLNKQSKQQDVILDKQFICNIEIPDQGNVNDEPIINKEILAITDEQLNVNAVKDSNFVGNCSIGLRSERDEQSNFDNKVTVKKRINDIKNAEQDDEESNSSDTIFAKSDGQPGCNITEVESFVGVENYEISCNKFQTDEHLSFGKKRQALKRSLSDSALNFYNSNNKHTQQQNEENVQYVWPIKRRRIIQNDILAQDLCSIIQNNRRNSVSAICNEENVSFCILIDNGCIITEEENEDDEKICYTNLSEECLAAIETKFTENEENIETKIISELSEQQHENDCEYPDSFIMHADNEKLEESWVEDVAYVETVISDDVAEDIEISGHISPKDNTFTDNDESGVFSSSEHTDRVKLIYGDKMCNDDAQFVETLYNTPQMDVNKTLVQREALISNEYYNNDSLEKILSESNNLDLSPCVSEYTETVYSPKFVDIKETVEDKENIVGEMISPLQDKVNNLGIAATGIAEMHQEHVKLCDLFDETQDDTVHSCESTVDDVFTYKENDENTIYTSSSPEVSSTTSEDKKSAILLKITNYQGSRISQINNIKSDSRRPSCKFTEDKDYVQSQSTFSTHRPLLTKAAQKYIPPLKESLRDLKIKLSLPQHSLMKLKQLKISKDEPKVCKQNVSVPRIYKKPKPKFEDVLKSLDEIQIKMHKEKTKKSKKSIPKVVIKKNENGSHYASTSNKDNFNPDLTGRKWQPWVFIEKNHFIDKMAMKKKTKAIYSHRKRTYVLAEKFKKYKSVNSGKFVITPPISDCPSAGLKYTIRLKHSY